MKDSTRTALIAAVAAVMGSAITGGVTCYTSSKKAAGMPTIAIATVSPTTTVTSAATATATANPTIIIPPHPAPPTPAEPVRRTHPRVENSGLQVAGSVNAPLQFNGANSHDNSMTVVGKPPRHVTDQNREGVLSSLHALIPKGSTVNVIAAMGDSEAITYALETYALLKSDGYNLPGKVTQGFAMVPKGPQTVDHVDGGLYQVFVNQNR